MQPSDLLDLVRTAYGLTSDYQLAKKFGFSTAGVSMWRVNRSFPKNSVLIQFGKILQINAGVLMLYSLEWREKDPEAKAQISRLIEAIAHAKFDDSFYEEVEQ
ncbi:hypothetical protein [Shewanella baltica]|uniref:hypothetical protein n=1 Tax=Shewanella baltica TaxID=62322 RepID=UPI00217D7996|nr:hypothetical protein [Shewanella baltica]MCS6180963.1 hypothetical protein [Shewanella baltica]MCS6257311.1 hypothetical protein [Shewanella baltica]